MIDRFVNPNNSSDRVAAAPKRGDHLYYYRGGVMYSHHGIFADDDTVVHYESSLGMKLVSSRDPQFAPRIKRVSFDEFALGNAVFIRPYNASDPVEVVLERALGRIGEVDYSLFDNNCEHFAVWCKTGWPHSTQIDAHSAARRAVVRGAPIGLSLLRHAGRVPVPYRGWAYLAAAAAAGTTYAGTYLAHRNEHRRARLS